MHFWHHNMSRESHLHTFVGNQTTNERSLFLVYRGDIVPHDKQIHHMEQNCLWREEILLHMRHFASWLHIQICWWVPATAVSTMSYIFFQQKLCSIGKLVIYRRFLVYHIVPFFVCIHIIDIHHYWKIVDRGSVGRSRYWLDQVS